MRHDDEIPVLIAGAGPAGAAAAIVLARAGVPSLVVDRRTAAPHLPRATSISTGSMELLRSWGLQDEVLDGGVDVEWVGLRVESLAEAAAGTPFLVGYPTRAEAALVSPTHPACVPQDHLEPLLLRHLASLGVARVERGVELVDARSTPDGVDATLRDAAGAVRTVRARHLIGADGAHSATRRALGIGMTGPEGLGERVGVHLRAPLWPLVGPHRHGIYDVSRPGAGGAFLPAGRHDRWIYGYPFDPAHTTPADHAPERVAARIRAAAGDPGLDPEILHIGTFSFAAQLADRFRAGNAFLAGDAAHRVTPRGGTGMNTALRDGRDLGWRLAWVLQGWADAALLDGYERERRPIAAHNAARSADPQGSIRPVAEELRADLGGRIPHAWVRGGVSTLDLLGPGFTLFTGPGAAAWERAAAAPGGAPVAVRVLDEVRARALGLHPGGALLARPDGLPVRRWARGAEADGLAAAMRTVTTAGARAVA